MAEKLLIILKNRQKGASMLEYALLAGLIAIVAIGGMQYLGNVLSGAMQDIGDTVAAGSQVTTNRAAASGAGVTGTTAWGSAT